MSDIEIRGYLALRPEVVALAVKLLRHTRIHPNFAGYLCVRRTIKDGDIALAVRPNFSQFFNEFLRPAGSESDKPFIRPFKENGDPAADVWMNSNVAGSYAPSSVRNDSPFRKVINIQGSGPTATYSLLPGHSKAALTYLLFGERLSAANLAAFLYRDFGFTGGPLTLEGLIKFFQRDFGFTEDEFNILFHRDVRELDIVAPHFPVPQEQTHAN